MEPFTGPSPVVQVLDAALIGGVGLGVGGVLGVEFSQRGRDVGGPPGPGIEPGREIVIRTVFPGRQMILSRIGRGCLGDHLGHDPGCFFPDAGRSPVRTPGSIGSDLGAIDRDEPTLTIPREAHNRST